MKQSMPGDPQGVGSVKGGAVSAQAPLVNYGPRKVSSADEPWAKNLAPEVRAAMRRNAFDKQGQGMSTASTEGLVLVDRSRRSDAEEDYLTALHEVFSKALERITARHRLYLGGVMSGQSTRQQADALSIDQANVVRGRQRALEALAKALGAAGTDDKPGIRRGLVAGTNFPLTEWLPGFTETKEAR